QSGAGNVSQSEHLGRRAREARGRRPPGRVRRLQDRRAGALSVRRGTLLACALAIVTATAAAHADDLLGDVTGADAAVQGDVEERLRMLLLHRLTFDREGLAADVSSLEARDDERRDAGLPRTGLTDDARYLAAAVAPTRDARREALHEVLHEHPDP